jgi:hypothetical protein
LRLEGEAGLCRASGAGPTTTLTRCIGHPAQGDQVTPGQVVTGGQDRAATGEAQGDQDRAATVDQAASAQAGPVAGGDQDRAATIASAQGRAGGRRRSGAGRDH